MVSVSAWIDGSGRFAVVATEANREQVLAGDSALCVQKFGMDRHLAGAIGGPVAHGLAAAVTGSGNRLETSPHDLKGLPQKQ